MKIQTNLEDLPQAALEVRKGAVTAMNQAARQALPHLNPGDPLPVSLARSLEEEQSAGSFEEGERSFLFTRTDARDRQLIFLHPAGDSRLTARQLDGFSRQMRSQLGNLLSQLDLLTEQLEADGPPSPRLSGISQSFYRMLRMMNNLEFLNLSQEELERQFYPVTMDLAGLCRDLTAQAVPLLRKAGFELRYESGCAGLLISGDPELLLRLLLELISNAAKTTPRSAVRLSLRPKDGRAVITVSGGAIGALGVLPDSEGEIPSPENGAGMGLAVARRIVQLHSGVLLIRRQGLGQLAYTLSLPTGARSGSLPLHSAPEREGGLSPFLLELADVLPDELFEPDPC